MTTTDRHRWPALNPGASPYEAAVHLLDAARGAPARPEVVAERTFGPATVRLSRCSQGLWLTEALDGTGAVLFVAGPDADPTPAVALYLNLLTTWGAS